MSQAHVTEPKPYCQICGREPENCESVTGLITCPKCESRRDRLRKEVEPEFSDDEPIPYTVTEKGWKVGS